MILFRIISEKSYADIMNDYMGKVAAAAGKSDMNKDEFIKAANKVDATNRRVYTGLGAGIAGAGLGMAGGLVGKYIGKRKARHIKDEEEKKKLIKRYTKNGALIGGGLGAVAGGIAVNQDRRNTVRNYGNSLGTPQQRHYAGKFINQMVLGKSGFMPDRVTVA